MKDGERVAGAWAAYAAGAAAHGVALRERDAALYARFCAASGRFDEALKVVAGSAPPVAGGRVSGLAVAAAADGLLAFHVSSGGASKIGLVAGHLRRMPLPPLPPPVQDLLAFLEAGDPAASPPRGAAFAAADAGVPEVGALAPVLRWQLSACAAAVCYGRCADNAPSLLVGRPLDDAGGAMPAAGQGGQVRAEVARGAAPCASH